MSRTTQAARWLRELAMEPLAAPRLASLGLAGAGEPLCFVFDGIAAPLRFERRGDAFAASIELDDDYDAAAAELVTLLGGPAHAGPDPAGVRWAGYRAAQSWGVLLLVERDGSAVLHLEPFARAKPFAGLTPDVASWFAARSAATSKPGAEGAKAEAAKRAARKAARGPKPGGRVSSARTKQLARWFAELGEATIDRAAIDAFAAEHELVLDKDEPFAGRTYLSAKLATRLHVDVALADVMTILAESEGGSGAEDALVATAHDRRHAAVLADVAAALGAPTAEGRHTYIGTERWAAWRLAEVVVVLISGLDPRGDGGHATALHVVTWPGGRAIPAFPRGVTDWVNARRRGV